MKTRTRILLACLAAIPAISLGHTVWLEQDSARPAEYTVRFGGHADRMETFKPAKLKTVTAVDAAGRSIAVTRSDEPAGVTLKVAGNPAVLLVHMDNGIHTRPPTGPTVEKPMNEVPGAKSATWAVKYHKSIVAWGAQAKRTFGQPFEVVPVESTQPRSGESMQFRILRDGKPLPGVRMGAGEEPPAGSPESDVNGLITITPVKGLNRWWAGKRFAVETPGYTELSYEYSLVFTAS